MGFILPFEKGKALLPDRLCTSPAVKFIMPLLARLLQFLEFLESLQEFLFFLTTPTGLSALLWVILYFPLQILGCDTPSAAILASTSALSLYCLLVRPDF